MCTIYARIVPCIAVQQQWHFRLRDLKQLKRQAKKRKAEKDE